MFMIKLPGIYLYFFIFTNSIIQKYRDKAFIQDIIPLIKLRQKRKSTSMLTDEFLQECYQSLTNSHISLTGHAPAYSEFSAKAAQARITVTSLFGKNYGNNELSYREKKLLLNRHPLTSLLAIIRKQGIYHNHNHHNHNHHHHNHHQAWTFFYHQMCKTKFFAVSM